MLFLPHRNLYMRIFILISLFSFTRAFHGREPSLSELVEYINNYADTLSDKLFERPKDYLIHLADTLENIDRYSNSTIPLAKGNTPFQNLYDGEKWLDTSPDRRSDTYWPGWSSKRTFDWQCSIKMYRKRNSSWTEGQKCTVAYPLKNKYGYESTYLSTGNNLLSSRDDLSDCKVIYPYCKNRQRHNNSLQHYFFNYGLPLDYVTLPHDIISIHFHDRIGGTKKIPKTSNQYTNDMIWIEMIASYIRHEQYTSYLDDKIVLTKAVYNPHMRDYTFSIMKSAKIMGTFFGVLAADMKFPILLTDYVPGLSGALIIDKIGNIMSANRFGYSIVCPLGFCGSGGYDLTMLMNYLANNTGVNVGLQQSNNEFKNLLSLVNTTDKGMIEYKAGDRNYIVIWKRLSRAKYTLVTATIKRVLNYKKFKLSNTTLVFNESISNNYTIRIWNKEDITPMLDIIHPEWMEVNVVNDSAIEFIVNYTNSKNVTIAISDERFKTMLIDVYVVRIPEVESSDTMIMEIILITAIILFPLYHFTSK